MKKVKPILFAVLVTSAVYGMAALSDSFYKAPAQDRDGIKRENQVLQDSILYEPKAQVYRKPDCEALPSLFWLGVSEACCGEQE